MIRCLATLTLCLGSAHASQTHTLSETTEIQAQVSSTELNRIIVEKDRISDVFTHSSSLEILPDERLGQIFVKTANPSSSGVRLTLTTEEGRVQDLRLRPQPIQGQTIILSELVNGEKPLFELQNTNDSLVSLLSNFLYGSIPTEFKACESCEEKTIYSSRQQTVEILTHTNHSDAPVFLEESLFDSHPNIQAILIDCPYLEPEESTQIWRVLSHD